MRARLALLGLFTASLLVACGYDPPPLVDSGLTSDSGNGALDGAGPTPGIDGAGPQATDTAMGGADGATDVRGGGGAGGTSDARSAGGAGGSGGVGSGSAGVGGTTGTGGKDDASVRDVRLDVPLGGNADVPPAIATGGSGGGGGSGGAGGTGGIAGPLAIDGFTAAPMTITVGKTATLNWTVSGAATLSIDQGVGVMTGFTSALVSPEKTTTYTLTAVDAAGKLLTAQVTVTVVAQPLIARFTATRTAITTGTSTDLTAEFGADCKASIDHGIGSVTSNVPVTTGPLSADTTFKLTVTNAAGDALTADVTITVAPAPVITSFTATPNPLAFGARTTLLATFADGTGVIDEGVGSVTSGTASVSRALSADTTFTLTVTNTVGDFITSRVKVTVVSPGSFAALGPTELRTWHTATLLASGKVLVSGGSSAQGSSLATAELFDPTTGTFTKTGSMLSHRIGHQATLLTSGKVLVTGGVLDSSASAPTAELYDPSTGTFTATGAMSIRSRYHTATRLPDGKVLIVGAAESAEGPASAELYDPTTARFTTVASSLSNPRQTPIAIGWPGTQKVLVLGDRVPPVDSYDATTATFSTAGELLLGRAYMTATMLATARVLVTGGFDYAAATVKSAELYDPALKTSVATSDMTTTRTYHSATLLDNGQVLVTGGLRTDTTSSALAAAELYDPTVAVFTATGTMAVPRYSHTSTTLSERRVLIVGGNVSGPGAEIYFY